MKKLILVVVSLLALNTSHVFAIEITPPNPNVETATAQALMATVTQLRASATPRFDGTTTLANERYVLNMIATSLAKLGRTEQALQITDLNLMLLNENYAVNEATQTREKVLQLSAHRAAALGNIQQAMNLASKIKNTKARDKAWLDVATANAKEEERSELYLVSRIIAEIKAPEIKAEARLALAKAYIAQDNKAAALKVLFQITPLVPQNFNILIRTAYLFSRSERPAVARRLFARAKNFEFDRTMREDYAHYLIQSGFVDQWILFCKHNPKVFQRGLGAMRLESLLRDNQIDAAIKAVRNSSDAFPGAKAAGLEMIAQCVSTRNPSRAIALRKEAVKDYASSLQKFHHYQINKHPNSEIYRDGCMLLAYMHHELNDEKQARQWLHNATKGASKEQVAYYMLGYTFIPLLRATHEGSKSTFTPDQLEQLNSEIQPYLQPAPDSEDIQYRNVKNWLIRFINVQIEAGQLVDAVSNTIILENQIKQRMAAGKYVKDGNFGDVYNVPTLWKKMKDQKQCNKFLQYLFNVPQNLFPSPKVERASSYIQLGFVEKGL